MMAKSSLGNGARMEKEIPVTATESHKAAFKASEAVSHGELPRATGNDLSARVLVGWAAGRRRSSHVKMPNGTT